ncbi:MAG TPA: NYN domain-containing protein [Candidatus Hydrogenedentes bacterium]|nr:NYN domain-containing protein [Candidatus Hydrogenedentota bacterium]
MAEHYLVDGYNVIYKDPSLRKILFQDIRSAREHLISRLVDFSLMNRCEVTVVFDGRHEALPSGSSVVSVQAPRLTITYTAERQSADAYIERYVQRYPLRSELVVVSNDRGIRDLCRGMGSLTVDSVYFLKTLQEQADRARERLEATRMEAARNRGRLEDALDEATREQLEAMKARLSRNKPEQKGES